MSEKVKVGELPGEALVERGVNDLSAGRETESALAVATAATRLRAAGVDVPAFDLSHPSHRLYQLLAESAGDDAHGRYNAMLRQLVSFVRAKEAARGRS